MRTIFIVLIIVTCLSGYAQTVDSVWIEQRRLQYLVDTGTFLPEVSLVDKKGHTVNLNQFTGKFMYIGLWSTSCGASTAEFPYQEQLLKRLKQIQIDSFFVFINIHVEDSRSDWKKTLRKLQPIGINLYSKDTVIISKWRLKGPPAYVLLDPNGRVLAKDVSEPMEAGLIDYILYCAYKGIRPVDAVLKHYEQGKLMEKYKSSSAITDPDYAIWFNKTIKSFIAFQDWRNEHMKENSR